MDVHVENALEWGKCENWGEMGEGIV